MNSFAELYASVESSASYQAEKLGVEFIADVYAAMQDRNWSQSDLARVLGVSSAYITKLFRSPTNLSLTTMAKLAQALELKVHVRVAPGNTEVHWRGIVRSRASAAANEHKTPDWTDFFAREGAGRKYDEAYALAA